MDFFIRFVSITLNFILMKNFLYLLLLISSLGFSQAKEFSFTKDGITDFLVIDVPGQTPESLYSKTLDWINTYYKSPKEVIKATILNDYIRIQGFSRELIVFNILGKKYYDASYQIEISFKEGKYKFDVIEVLLLNTMSDPNMSLTNINEYYKKSGELKGNYKYYPESFTSFFNKINHDLENFLNGTTSAKRKDW
jgi:hypothetical protein